MLQEDQGQIVKPGVYEHYKGQRYLVMYTATHSETLESLVVYQQLYGQRGIWVRPVEMFIENVTVDEKSVPRFKFVSNSDE